jgi:hypothetical protein
MWPRLILSFSQLPSSQFEKNVFQISISYGDALEGVFFYEAFEDTVWLRGEDVDTVAKGFEAGFWKLGLESLHQFFFIVDF